MGWDGRMKRLPKENWVSAAGLAHPSGYEAGQ